MPIIGEHTDTYQAPDLIEPLAGVRAWSVHYGALVGPLSRHAWSPTETAFCLKEDHRAPVSACSCGLYAFSDTKTLEHHYPLAVTGIVQGSGVCEVHADGFRSEHMEIRALARLPWWKTGWLKSHQWVSTASRTLKGVALFTLFVILVLAIVEGPAEAFSRMYPSLIFFVGVPFLFLMEGIIGYLYAGRTLQKLSVLHGIPLVRHQDLDRDMHLYGRPLDGQFLHTARSDSIQQKPDV